MSKVRILGTRGIPASHGGFETFAESLAPYLVSQGWDVTVYCQAAADAVTADSGETTWNGVRLKHIPVKQEGPLGTILFDWRCTMDALREPEGVNLVLGYNTAVFSLLYRLRRRVNLINMDGLEWRRSKWSGPIRAWFFINERLGCWLGNHLIADNPEIERHLATRVSSSKITMIPYGADPVTTPGTDALAALGVEAGQYALVVARPEPENSVLDIAKAFSMKKRGYKLVMLGNYDTAHSAFCKQVVDAASEEVIFPGAIFDHAIVAQLRAHARLYVHGHQVGGTNPALVEAMAAGCPVLAHDNRFNRWVAGAGAAFFKDAAACAARLDVLLDAPGKLEAMARASRVRFAAEFTWDHVLPAYAKLLAQWTTKNSNVAQSIRGEGSIRSS